jgi:multidrug efflux pump subunit AcrB
MSIGGFSIKKKYVLLAVTIAIVLAGVYALLTINTQLAPDTNPPMATVITRYPGATAQDVVLDVVEPMEKEFMMLDGVQQIKSTSQDNSAVIQVEFSYATSIDEAAVDLQNAISSIRDQLPDQMQEPRIMKFSASDKPILTVSLSSDSLSMQDTRQLAEDRIAYELQLVDGVAAVEVFGGYRNEVQVQVDRDDLAFYSLTLQQIAEAIGQSNVKAPGGKVLVNEKEVMIRVQEGYEFLEDLQRLTLNLPEGRQVYLSDIADISLAVESLESSYRFNGEESIALMITKQGSANTIQVVETLLQRIEALEAAYPVLNFSIAQDDSVFTKQMVNNMTSSVLLAILMTVVVIILFIGNISQSLAVSISMPLVFLSTIMLMKFTGMELDMVTLSALILSIGFVVDGAVVVVENIMSHRLDQGKNIISAAIDGTNEIALPPSPVPLPR